MPQSRKIAKIAFNLTIPTLITPVKQSDEHLVAAIKRDDHAAFSQLFHKYGKAVYAFIQSILKNEAETEEAVQDIFVKVWEKRKNLDPSLSFKSYLFTIASNKAKKIFRQKNLAEKYSRQVAMELGLASDEDLNIFEYRDLLNYVDSIILKLPEARRQIFVMSRKNGLKNAEIAARLGISEQTVKNQLVTAQKFLRAEASNDGRETGFNFFLLFYRI